MSEPLITYPNILVVGPSGSGKSTSLRNLDPERTKIIHPERKALPFKGAGKFKHNIFCGIYADVLTELMKAGTDNAIDNVVVESFTTADEMVLEDCRKNYKGFEVYSRHNESIRNLIKQSKLLGLPANGKTPKFVIFTGLDEIVDIAQPDGSNKSTRRLKVEGRELQGTIEKEFTIVLFTEVKQVMTSFEYKFLTNTDSITSAKSPMGMFERFIDNDLNLVIKKCREYYEIK